MLKVDHKFGNKTAKLKSQAENFKSRTPEFLPIKPPFSLFFVKTNSKTIHKSLASNISDSTHLPFPCEPGFSLFSFRTSETFGG